MQANVITIILINKNLSNYTTDIQAASLKWTGQKTSFNS